MSPREEFEHRERVIVMLAEIGPQLERINRSAAETAWRTMMRLCRLNVKLAARLDLSD